jgi:hypothetical protein
MTTDWTPVFVLPNIPLEAAIGCDIAALAPAHDRRVAALKRAHPTLRRFLNRFADNFGQKFEPTQVRLDAAERALDVRRDRAVAAEQTMPPKQPQIARLRHRMLWNRRSITLAGCNNPN